MALTLSKELVCIKLQKHDADIVTAYRHIDLVIEEASYMREDFDSVWSEWFGEAESLATDIGSSNYNS